MVNQVIGNRQRSLDRAATHIGLVVIEAPPGFEADRFVDRLLSLLGTPTDLLDPDDVEANAIPQSAILRAPLQTGLRGWRDTVVRRFEEKKSTLLLLPAGVSGDLLIDEPLPTLLIDAAALRMSVPDILDMGAEHCGVEVIGPGIAELLAQLSDGWPVWLQACCELVTEQQIDAEKLAGAVGMPPFRKRIVDRFLKPFSPSDRYRLAQLAHFQQFSERSATALGGADFALATLPQAPGLYRKVSGQLSFVDPVRLTLAEACPLDPASAELLAPVLVSEGELLVGCQALLEGGLHDEACSLIEALPGRVIDMTDQRELLGVLRVLADRVGEHPGLAMKQARIHANLAEIAESVESCEVAINASLQHDPIRLEASVELLLYRHRSISQEEAADTLAELRDLVGSTGPLSTRLREVEAQILGQSPDPHVVQAAADRFIEVASEWEYQQEYLRAAKTLRALAMGPLLHLGHYREGQERLERALKLSIEQVFDYGVTLVNKTALDARCRDFDAMASSRGQAGLLVAESGLRWLEGYLYLADAYAAADAGSAAAVRSCLRTGRGLLGSLLPTDAGLFFTSEGAVLLAEVGDHEGARQALDSVAGQVGQNPMEFYFSEVIVLARAGKIEAARAAWSRLDDLGVVPNDRRWRIDAELARADVLCGLKTDVDVSSITKDLKRLGMSDLLAKICPELTSEKPSKRLRIELFDELAVSGVQGVVALPLGHVTELIKIIAVVGGSAHVETVAHHLWPDIDRSIGLRRLKNVVRKAREHLGESAIVRASDRVSFGSDIVTDIADFEALAAEAFVKASLDPVASRTAALAALEVYSGPLLRVDLFSDLVNERRFELQLRAEELLEFVERRFKPNAAWLGLARKRIKAI